MKEAATQPKPEDNATEEPRRMLNEAQLLEIVPVSRVTLYRLERDGLFPRSTYVSANRRLWFADEVAAWQREVDLRNPNRGRGKGRKRRAPREQSAAQT